MSPRQGGESYPSGTPPYGVPGDAAFSRSGQPPQAGRPGPGGAAQPENGADAPHRDEPRTETTLTTRIKINIPGARPIPEVVVRSPLNEETGEQPAPRRRRADTSGSPVLGVMDSGAGTTTPPDLPPEWLAPGASEQPTSSAQDAPSAPAGADGGGTPPSEWFAPRKKSAPPAAASAPASPAPPPGQPLFQEPPAAPPVAPTPGFEAQQPQSPLAPSPDRSPQPPMPKRRGKAAPTPTGPSADGSMPPGYDQPYGSGRDALPDAQPWSGGALPQRPQPTPGQQPPQGQQAPPGPTLPPRPVPGSIAARLGGATAEAPASTTGVQPTLQFRSPADQLTDPQTGFPPAPPMPGEAVGAPIATPTPAGPGPQPGQHRQQKGGKGGQQQGAKAAKGGKAGGGNAAGQTATLPPVPRPQPIADGFAGGTGGVSADPRPEPAGGGQGTGASTAPSGKAGRAKRGGGKARKLAGYAVGVVVVAGAGAYGAGLMMNQADIPKGTTVLGQAIGGDTRDQALDALEHTLGPLSARPIQVSIGGKPATLNPSVAGLTIDATATVDSVAHHDYNPVTVVQSLLGTGKAVAPVVTIDPDKLRSALQQLAASSSGNSAGVHFVAGKAVVTPPKAGSGLDVDAAMPLVEQAFRARANGGQVGVVALSVTTVQPKGSAAAADAAARTIGAWAMKQPFQVTAGGKTVLFGKNTFSQALTLRPDASGAFVPVFNLAKLKAAYGPAFDGVQTKDGRPVTPQDVAIALVSLLSKPDGSTSVGI
ncbi:hypothetical protein DN069_15840 [Streptacidiphilus pinicola]|uniref:Peptidoglycan binding domain-containing protein n=1 Tax=Streptacidiphilus pinicola TaxID=2219663 RepID=A0A2X0IHR4_9ACTN|nr:hypothetical protein [Streptacidiphilus pinicola]RAG84642.1 hypothetical protein DN069_15840 [Streptacidiphilus pinicola]